MQFQSNDLLKVLGSGVRPIGAGASNSTPSTPIESQAFSQLLASAQTGALTGGAPVTVAKGSGVNLSPEQLQRLAPAVDAAAVAGVNHLLAVIDGRAVTIDVRTRQVDGEASVAAGELIRGCDAATMIPAAPLSSAAPSSATASGAADPAAAGAASAGAAPAAPAQIVPLPGAESIQNASLGDILSRLTRAA